MANHSYFKLVNYAQYGLMWFFKYYSVQNFAQKCKSHTNLEVNFFCLSKTRIERFSQRPKYLQNKWFQGFGHLVNFCKNPQFLQKSILCILLFQDCSCSWRKIMKFLAIYEKFLMDFWQDLNYYTLEPLASYKCFGYSLILDVQMWNNVIYDEFEY